MVRFSASVVTTSKPIVRYHEAVDGLQLHAFGDAWTYGIGARVPNRFGGMRDLAIFRGDIRDLSRKQGREAGISVASGSGNSYFWGVGMRDWQGKRSGIRDFNSNVTSYQRKNRKLAEMNLLCV